MVPVLILGTSNSFSLALPATSGERSTTMSLEPHVKPSTYVLLDVSRTRVTLVSEGDNPHLDE